jgi:hypothetical protein
VTGFFVSVLGLAEGVFTSLAGAGFVGGFGLNCDSSFPHPNARVSAAIIIVVRIVDLFTDFIHIIGASGLVRGERPVVGAERVGR